MPCARAQCPSSGKDLLRSRVLIVTMRPAVLQQALYRGALRLDGPSDGTSSKDDEFHRIRPPVATMSEVCVIVVDSLPGEGALWSLRPLPSRPTAGPAERSFGPPTGGLWDVASWRTASQRMISKERRA